MKDRIKNIYWRIVTKNLSGIGVIEIILILVVIIGLVLIFRKQIVDIVSNAFESINENTQEINTQIPIGE